MISVVIPVFNGASHLGEQLEALARQTYAGSWELVVVDNGSTDGSLEVLLAWAEILPLRVHACEEQGVNATRNAGVRHASGERLAFLDQDDVAQPGWLEAIALALDAHLLVGGRIDYAQLNSAFLRSTRGQAIQVDELPTYEGVRFSLGSNMACHREVFERVEGFDAGFRYGADDIDFFFKAHLAGIDAEFVPEAVVARRERELLRSFARQWYRYTVARAQIDAKYRRQGAIGQQSSCDRLVIVGRHLRALLALRMCRTRSGRWRYTQRLAKATGALVGYARFGQLAV